MADDSDRVPVTLCWHCDRPLDAARALDDVEGVPPQRPHDGAVSLCMYCGAVGIFGPDLKLYAPTEIELDELQENVEFRKTYTQFSWARQHLMLRTNLMRDHEDPDR